MQTYKTYQDLQTSAIRSQFNEHNDCTVVAVTLTAEVSYEEAHAALKTAGRRNRCGAYAHQQEKALLALGAKIEKIPTPRKPNGRGYPTKTIGKALGRGNFYVFVSRHAVAVINGEVQDWSAGRAKRIVTVWKITPPGAVAPSVPTPAPKVATKKVGAKVIVTDLNGKAHHFTSVLKAFQALELDVKKHQKFRFELKRTVGGLHFNGYHFRSA